MRVQYCWRCAADVPMMDEREFEAWQAVFERCMRSAKSYRTAYGSETLIRESMASSKKRARPTRKPPVRRTPTRTRSGIIAFPGSAHRVQRAASPCARTRRSSARNAGSLAPGPPPNEALQLTPKGSGPTVVPFWH